MTLPTIGFIGLGAMGAGMVRNLLGAGFEVAGFDVRDEALAWLKEQGGKPARSPAGAADRADLLFLMVVNDAQVETVLFGDEGALASLPSGATVVMCSTVPAAFAKRLGQRLVERDVDLLDAPVSGGAIGAERGSLTVMASGSTKAFEAAETALKACGERVFQLGDEVGIGSSVKAVNQLLAGVNLVTAAEGMAFGVAQGADPKLLFEIIKDAAGGSWMFGDRVPHMLADDYTPQSTVDIWTKDLGLVLEQARLMGMPVPMAAAAHQIATMAVASGHGKIDDAALVKVYEAFTGAPVASKQEAD